MVIYDELYGEFEVAPIIEALIQTETFQRLKDIHMAGAAYLVEPKWNETRYEHSIGVMLLIKKLGGSLEEQIAGLLHDISHTAFSHLVDYIFERPAEDYHEHIKKKFLEGNDIEQILQHYNLNVDQLLYCDSHWQLLEQEAPHLCVDRIDYTLREIHRYYNVSINEIYQFLEDLIFESGELCVQSIEQAEWFVEQYYRIVVEFFYDPKNIYGTDQLKKVLEVALKKNVIVEADFLLTETQLLNKIVQYEEQESHLFLKRITELPELIIVKSNEGYDFSRKNKVRYVDPTIFYKGVSQPVSHVSEKAKQKIEQTQQAILNGQYIKIN